ncbi:hypothetical protein ABK040_014565 [Willaertia magna]
MVTINIIYNRLGSTNKNQIIEVEIPEDKPCFPIGELKEIICKDYGEGITPNKILLKLVTNDGFEKKIGGNVEIQKNAVPSIKIALYAASNISNDDTMNNNGFGSKGFPKVEISFIFRSLLALEYFNKHNLSIPKDEDDLSNVISSFIKQTVLSNIELQISTKDLVDCFKELKGLEDHIELKINPSNVIIDSNTKFKAKFITNLIKDNYQDSSVSLENCAIFMKLHFFFNFLRFHAKMEYDMLDFSILDLLSFNVVMQQQEYQTIFTANRYTLLKDIINDLKKFFKLKGEDPENRNNLIIRGESGSGKTYTAELLHDILGLEKIFIGSGGAIYHKYVGEAEKRVKEWYEVLPIERPYIAFLIFIDEAHVLEPTSNSNDSKGNIMSVLLNKLRSKDSPKNVITILGTNKDIVFSEELSNRCKKYSTPIISFSDKKSFFLSFNLIRDHNLRHQLIDSCICLNINHLLKIDNFLKETKLNSRKEMWQLLCDKIMEFQGNKNCYLRYLTECCKRGDKIGTKNINLPSNKNLELIVKDNNIYEEIYQIQSSLLGGCCYFKWINFESILLEMKEEKNMTVILNNLFNNIYNDIKQILSQQKLNKEWMIIVIDYYDLCNIQLDSVNISISKGYSNANQSGTSESKATSSSKTTTTGYSSGSSKTAGTVSGGSCSTSSTSSTTGTNESTSNSSSNSSGTTNTATTSNSFTKTTSNNNSLSNNLRMQHPELKQVVDNKLKLFVDSFVHDKQNNKVRIVVLK